MFLARERDFYVAIALVGRHPIFDALVKLSKLGSAEVSKPLDRVPAVGRGLGDIGFDVGRFVDRGWLLVPIVIDIIGNVKGTTLASVALGLTIALLGGCKKDIENKEAVRQGVMNYLAKRQDLLAMDVSVTAVDFKEDEATATVRFQAKGNNSPAGSMSMQYVLEKKSGQWVVKGRGGSGSPHSGIPPGGMPPSGMPGGMPQDGGGLGAMPQTMPPGHPSVGGGGAPTQALPPGHPSVGNAK